MALLVDRRLPTRHHGRGTFVGEGMRRVRKSARLRTIYVLLPEEQLELTGVQLDVIIKAIRSHVRGVAVQFNFVPAEGGLDHVRDLVTAAQESGQFAGAVPISCSRAVYRYLAQVGSPAVVLGSVYEEAGALPSVDMDYRQAGYLLASHLVRRGHRRLALLSTGDGRPGDNAFYDGVSEALTEAKLPHNALVVRPYPREVEAFHSQLRQLLRRDDRPTSVICGSARFIAAVQTVASELNLKLPADLELAFESQATPDAEGLPHAHVRPTLSFESTANLLAGMLSQLSEGQVLEKSRVVVPVELRVP
jgi:LacI family transcriptional regulator